MVCIYMYVCKNKALDTSIVTKEVRPIVKGGKTFLRELPLLQMNPFAFKIRHIFITDTNKSGQLLQPYTRQSLQLIEITRFIKYLHNKLLCDNNPTVCRCRLYSTMVALHYPAVDRNSQLPQSNRPR